MTRTSGLTDRERKTWRAVIFASETLTAQVARDVAEATGLSAADFAVLENLFEIGAGRLRQRDLAQALDWDKSRISHQLTRMQERKLLTRTKTVSEGSQVAMTRLGRDTLARARPVHAVAVRRHVIERLTPDHAAAFRSLGDESWLAL